MDLITGATGFIGRHLALRLLAQGRPVRVLCRPKSVQKLDARLTGSLGPSVEIAPGDLKDRDSLFRAMTGVSRVYHCAGQVADWGAQAEFESANVQGTRWLLEAALQSKDPMTCDSQSASFSSPFERFVHLSSIAVFGTPAPRAFDDSTPYGLGTDPYTRTKIEGEKQVLDFYKNTGLPVSVLRPAVVYGPYSTWVEEPLKMIRRGQMFLLGGGQGTCHPCYIENLLDAMELVSRDPQAIGQAYIIADDEPITFKEYFNHLANFDGKGPISKSIPLPVARLMATGFETGARILKTSQRPLLTHTAIHMVSTPSQMSMKKIRQELGFRPRFDVKAAMKQLQSFYQSPSGGSDSGNSSQTSSRSWKVRPQAEDYRQ